jgi:hypothetical protein
MMSNPLCLLHKPLSLARLQKGLNIKSPDITDTRLSMHYRTDPIEMGPHIAGKFIDIPDLLVRGDKAEPVLGGTH